MPGKNLAALAESLAAEGLAHDLPCVVVSRASQPGETVQRLTLATLSDAEPIEAPSLILLGKAVGQPGHDRREVESTSAGAIGESSCLASACEQA